MRDNIKQIIYFAFIPLFVCIIVTMPSRAYASNYSDVEDWATLNGWLSSINGELQLIYGELQAIYDEMDNISVEIDAQSVWGGIRYSLPNGTEVTDFRSVLFYYLENIRYNTYDTNNRLQWFQRYFTDNLTPALGNISNIASTQNTIRSELYVIEQELQDLIDGQNSIALSMGDIYTEVTLVNNLLAEAIEDLDTIADHLLTIRNYVEAIYDETANIYDRLSVTNSAINNVYIRLNTTNTALNNIYTRLANTNSAINNVYNRLNTTNTALNNIYDALDFIEFDIISGFNKVKDYSTVLNNILSVVQSITIPDYNTKLQQITNAINDGVDELNDTLVLIKNLLGELLGWSNSSNRPDLSQYTINSGNHRIWRVQDDAVLQSLSDIRNTLLGLTNYLLAKDLIDAIIGEFDLTAFTDGVGQLTDDMQQVLPFGAILVVVDLISIWAVDAPTSMVLQIPFDFVPGVENIVQIDLTVLDPAIQIINFLVYSIVILALVNITVKSTQLEVA